MSNTAILHQVNGTAFRPPASPPETWTCPVDGTQLRLIPAGEFVMGSTMAQIAAAKRLDQDSPLFALSPEAPQFATNVPAFYLGTYAVTNAQFARFLTAMNPSPDKLAFWIASLERLLMPVGRGEPWQVARGYENHPVPHVSWGGADAYCSWAGLRLPTEIEWEKGARGSDGRIFPWGNEWRDDVLRWHGGTRGENETTAPVDAYPEGRSPYGLFQMAGNVEEWCAEPYRPEIYSRYARGDFTFPTTGYGRVVRGGACLRRNKLEFRCAMRRGNPAAFVNIIYTGFRCACDPAMIRTAQSLA